MAYKFVEELIALGVYERVPPGSVILNNCPLFLVPKPGQPGQWRCIANMKDGGQNEVCVGRPRPPLPTPRYPPSPLPGRSSPPSSMPPSSSTCSPHGRTSGSIMGLIHPTTGEHWWHTRFPMGSTNSPGRQDGMAPVSCGSSENTVPCSKGPPGSTMS